MIRLFLLFLILLVSGCATQLAVTYISDPPGAVLYTEGRRIGYTPQTLYYEVTEEKKKVGRMVISGAHVQWASGVTAGNKDLAIDLVRYGYSPTYTFNRPNVPGREKDIQFSMELERTRAMQRQAAAAEDQARAAEDQARAAKAQAAAAASQRTLNCTSTNIGGIVSTSCN